MARIRVKHLVPTKQEQEGAIRQKVALFCYFYPQYTYDAALDLQITILDRLLKVANQQRARNYLILTQIAAAPHTKRSVQKLIQALEDELHG